MSERLQKLRMLVLKRSIEAAENSISDYDHEIILIQQDKHRLRMKLEYLECELEGLTQ